MTVLRFLLFVTMFEFVTLRTILETEDQSPICPDYCSCDFIDKVVNCSHNTLSNVPQDIFRNVTLLDLSFNKFDGIPKGIRSLPNILHLDLSHNPEIRLIEINFESVPLRNLQLEGCSIDYIDNSVFRGFPNLEILKLSENPIYFLNNSLVSLSLKSLDFSRCNLRHIKPNSFKAVTSLLYLSLSENHNLRQFHCDSDSLLTLDISNCNLEHVPSSSLRKVVELDLHGNNIQWLRNKSFTNISNVENLNISYNAIKLIEMNSFSHLSHLTVLDISYNRLNVIDKNTFKKNDRLKSLYMSHNYLKQINGIASTSVELLDLNSCEIEFLYRYSLTNLPALTELHLVRNRISHIPDNIEAPHLVYFDIGYNDISSINNETFAMLKSLRFLVLSGNKLTTVEPTFFPQVIDLAIEDNPWLCDCEALRQIYNWMVRTDQNTKYLRCQLPVKLEGLTWEEACSNTWSKVHLPQRSVWWYSLSFFITVGILLVLIYISKRMDQHRKNLSEQEAEERLAASARLEAIQRQQTRERLRRLEEQEESRNAPDPRESMGPPTYNEALMLPRLDASHPSLAGSLPSLSSLHNSNTDVSKRRKRRRRRRRKSSSSQPEADLGSNHTDVSENERQLNATELEESSF